MWKEMYNVNVVVSGGGGWKSITPSWMKFKGVTPPLDFYKVITPKAFDLVQVIHDHRQVGQAGKNDIALKEACLNFGQ